MDYNRKEVNNMNDRRCKDCEKCIIWRGRARCGRGDHGYKYIDKNDPACEQFDEYEIESEESES